LISFTKADSCRLFKREIFRDSVIAGSIGTVVAQITRGTDDALCYAAGAAAGVGYLYFLSMKVR
jgi:hypothetical protein